MRYLCKQVYKRSASGGASSVDQEDLERRHQDKTPQAEQEDSRRRRRQRSIKMTGRSILGNVQNIAVNQAVHQGGKILQVANWLTGRAGHNKENILPQQISGVKQEVKPTPRYGVKRSNKKLCVEQEQQPMDIEQETLEVASVPEGVIDIDKEEEDVNACGEYARDIYAYLKCLENAYPVHENYLDGQDISSKMRSLLIDWMVSVHQQFELSQETLFLSVNYLDRYLQSQVETTPRDQLQLVGVTAMFLACKVEEIYLPSIEDFVYSTDNAYTEAELRAMEIKMINVLNFDLNSPIPLSFLRRYSKAGDVDVLEHTLAKYILELSLLDFGQAALPPSMTAAAALHLSLQLLEPDVKQPWNLSLQYHSGYTTAMLQPIIARMSVVLTNSETHKLQAVRQKYCSRKFRRVALIRELGAEFIKRRVQLG